MSLKVTNTDPEQQTHLETFDGTLLRDLVRAGLVQLQVHKERVNALNVFPVPDGDTGTNMLLTMQSAVDRLAKPSDDAAHAGKVAQLVARGALMGARGNSGVILSQIWRGFARATKEHATIDSVLFTKALREAAETAYQGVMSPVEGTILTICRAMADSAEKTAATTNDLHTILATLVADCQVALANTPEQLPILKQAGVVDSGGQGLLYILEGMLRWLNGGMRSLDIHASAASSTRHASAQALARPEDGVIENPYDVQFILQGTELDVATIRDTIDAMGDSTVVVGDSETIKVHVHVKDPGQPLSYGVSLGHISDIVVENMQAQMEEMIADGTATAAVPLLDSALQPGQLGVVATAPGSGLANVLRSLGVTIVIDGGQTNNPSTEQIFAAIQDVPSNRVIVLPNNKNIQMAAESARDLSSKEVVVVPTRSVPQAVSALIAYDANGETAQVAQSMTAALADIVTGGVTTAVRDVELDGVAVTKGELIGLVDGQLRVSAEHMPTLISKLLDAMELEDRELVTLYYGADVTEEEAETVADQIESRYPDIEVETVSGGQAHYDYILGAE